MSSDSLSHLPRAAEQKWLQQHPCGDKTHDVFKNQPALEEYVRRNCIIPKSAVHTRDSNNYEIITTCHRLGAINEEESKRLNTHAKNCWLVDCGKMPFEKMMEERRKLAKKAADGVSTVSSRDRVRPVANEGQVQKYYGDEAKLRQIADKEDWDLLLSEEADEAAEFTGSKSGLRVVQLNGGLS